MMKAYVIPFIHSLYCISTLNENRREFVNSKPPFVFHLIFIGFPVS